MRIANGLKSYAGLPKSIYILFFASIINNTGNFVAPFLTIFLTKKLAFAENQTGLLVMVSALSALTGALIGGKLIDHMGRKKILVIFQTLVGISYLPAAFLGTSLIIPFLLVLASFFGGIANPVYGTIVTDLTKGEERNVAFSLTYLAMNIGFAVGPLIAGFLYENHMAWIFIGDALTTFISVGLVSIYVAETLPDKQTIDRSKLSVDSDERAETGSLLNALGKRPNLVFFSLITMLYFFIFSQFTFGLAIQVIDVFKENGSTIFGTLMTTNALVVVLLTTIITSFTKQFKSIINMTFGGLFYAIGFGMLFFINSHFLFIISAVIWSIGEILIATNTSVYIANHTPVTHRGRFNSVFTIIRKVGFASGPAVMGTYIAHYNIRFSWIIIFILSLVTSSFMYLLFLSEKQKNSASENFIAN